MLSLINKTVNYTTQKGKKSLNYTYIIKDIDTIH